jgi:hypothetical protein
MRPNNTQIYEDVDPGKGRNGSSKRQQPYRPQVSAIA